VPPVSVVKPNEIVINGYRFRTKGRVRIANIAVTPNPITYGDTSRQGDTQVMSQLISITASGGSGVYRANPRTDIERFWTSAAETRYRLQISLPPLTYTLGRPSALVTEDPLLSREYANSQYFVFSGGKLYRWNDIAASFNDNGTVTGGWSALIATLTGNPTDAEVFKDYLYFAYDTATQKMVVSGGVETLSSVSGAARYLKVWDEKLWKLYLDSSNVWTTAYSSAGGAIAEAWTVGGTLPSHVTPTHLTTFRNVVGDEVLALLTNVGLWLYDASNAKWRQTEVRIPAMPTTQRSVGDIFRDGRLYFTTGNMGLIAVQPGNPFVVTPVGLDRDDGVPADESGKFVDVVSDFNWIFALLDGSVSLGNDELLSGLAPPFDSPGWPTSQGLLTLRAFNGAWSTLWRSSPTSTPGYFLTVSGAYSKRRVYWGAGGNAYCQDLPDGVFNPRFNPTSKFAPGPVEHTTSWYDYGSDVQRKVQGHFWMRTTGCSATEIISVYYQRDLDESSWTLLDTLVDDGPDGMTELKPGGSTGVQCRLIRFKFVLSRGADADITPRIEFWAADFLRVLPATYAFVTMLDLSKAHNGRSPQQLVQILKDLSDPEITPNMIQFAYQDDLTAEPQTFWGRISRLQGETVGGAPQRGEGWFQLSFMVPYLGDAE
jgi:hypothetical protein